jgi:hypothetical protein
MDAPVERGRSGRAKFRAELSIACSLWLPFSMILIDSHLPEASYAPAATWDSRSITMSVHYPGSLPLAEAAGRRS